MRRRFPLAATAAAAFLAVVVVLPLASAATSSGSGKAKAKAPVAPPAPPNITALMSKGGCKAFASLVEKSPDALSAFQSAVEGGVTAFCPTDDAVRSFMPSYKNLTADGKASLLLFHAVPVYYTLGGLKSSNGPMNTLATDGSARNYNFTVQNVGDQVSIRTEASDAAARVRSTVYDKDPVAIYAVDAVLEPVELFEPVEAPAPAPAPVADAPRASSKSKGARHPPRHVADAPGPAADDAAPADQKKNAKKNAAAGGPCPRWLAAIPAAVAAALV
ncbi:Fasciclin-like arabinogalactan protein 1 [Dichanthelium oligosanthes]|uniref:Fasciclin-like arabinogalactan protein 1 n=1 Tax=Dichanthelium oligosanthes TaxID=888268 RepID=A0A1E5V0Q6_9POAL|nr:Fasciclin-like arabinogalactan protein 1 [Dichanthelium oligosanthes]